jgi:hypothetical protein
VCGGDLTVGSNPTATARAILAMRARPERPKGPPHWGGPFVFGGQAVDASDELASRNAGLDEPPTSRTNLLSSSAPTAPRSIAIVTA